MIIFKKTTDKCIEVENNNNLHFYQTLEPLHKLYRLVLLVREGCEQMKRAFEQNQET